jgi:hypothetical protein
VIGVVIPSRAQRQLLTDLIVQLVQDGGADRIVVLDNGYDPPLGTHAIAGYETVRDESPSIYALWNHGFARARAAGCDKVVLLNDDVELIGPNWLRRLTAPLHDETWVTCPDHTRRLLAGAYEETSGTYRHGGMPGFAFAVDASALLSKPFDERYSWWYGDDDFVFRVERDGGRIVRVGGLHLNHVESATLNQTDVRDAVARDAELFHATWGAR